LGGQIRSLVHCQEISDGMQCLAQQKNGSTPVEPPQIILQQVQPFSHDLWRVVQRGDPCRFHVGPLS
jgi:hypothetical protein